MLPFLPEYMRFQWHGHKQAWQIFTHMTKQERLILYRLALDQSPDSVLLEIGSYIGASSCFLAAAASEIQGKVKVYCVDTWQNEGMFEGQRDTFDEFRKNTAKYEEFIVILKGTSHEIANNFYKKVDFLFIDGDHSYEGVKSDVDDWFPKLNDGGIVIFHDIGWAEGVQRVVEESVRPHAKRESRMPNMYWAWL
ncbi:MAG: class I SAM-dependent methyltransferase [Syntrophorhabdaceae bacterium]|nr:class I SAM-dependent methyltransferase [Syntrophorhabdaceae bacterium]